MAKSLKKNLIGLSFEEVKAEMEALDLESFRAKQVWSWMYCHGAKEFAAMSNLAKPVRGKLAEHFTIGRPSISAHQQSEDGTRKWLLRMEDGQEIECVHIPEEDRGALCVSSQVGCPMGCAFCHTGTQKLVRNLTASEIVGQVLLARDELNAWPSTLRSVSPCGRGSKKPACLQAVPAKAGIQSTSPLVFAGEGVSSIDPSPCHSLVSDRPRSDFDPLPLRCFAASGDLSPDRPKLAERRVAARGGCTQQTLSNIVMMGMGEPLNNFDNVAKALKIIMDSDGIAIGRRKITLSTSGVVPMIKRCGEELGVNLAISLHAVTDEVRDKLMPINRKYPIRDLIQACRDYPGASNARRITFEYVMLKGVNDSPANARTLIKLLAGVPAKINLLPYNPWPGSPYECSDEETIRKFGDIVNRAGYVSPVRTPRGRDIMAACGQLKSASERKKS
jgi:adenine C2-methylase RlmN of 23S rRNA A2503 and tRNA A37